ncbi:DUF6029 family protein [Candidatus Kapabacteria bacterium]|nr:DUF6029 family protein [Candidatus Kapabacteria bacterium]
MRILTLLLLLTTISYSQDLLGGQIHGYAETNGAYYRQDSLIGAPDVAEKFLNNSFLNLIYTNNNVEVGFRYESYQNPLLGFDNRFKGQGIPYRYVTYKSDLIDVTVGNFYEQFGTGMVLRSYEERNLGIDNTLDGVRFKIRPIGGVEIKGLYGKARTFWELSNGIIRGADLNVVVNDLIPALGLGEIGYENQVSIGGSVVSRFQEDNSAVYNLPENVLTYAARLSAVGSFYSFDAEYMYKYNDPIATNLFRFNDGQGVKVLGALFSKGISFNFNYHYIQNIDFRVDREAVLLNLPMNFVPPLTRQQTYLLATVYPYGTQPNGETGIGMDAAYQFKRGSLIGGKYGARFGANYSVVYGLDSTENRIIDPQDPTKTTSLDYDVNFMSPGDSLFYRELNLDFSKKLTKNFKFAASYINAKYNRELNEGKLGYSYVNTNIFIAEGTYKFNDDYALRLELQYLNYDDDGIIQKKYDESESLLDPQNGDWYAATAEFTIAPHYYFTYIHQYNSTNVNPDLRVHYPTANFTYVYDATRFMIGYSRIRSGLLCVGGVCRVVPSSNGFNFTISTSF